MIRVFLLAALTAVLIIGHCPAGEAKDKKADKERGLLDGLKALKHADPKVRYDSVVILMQLGRTAKFAAPALMEMLSDPNVTVRLKVCEALWELDRPPAAALLPVLQKATEHTAPEVRANALEVLGKMGAAAKPALPTVLGGLKDKDFNVRLQAVLALAGMGPAAKTAAPDLLALAATEDSPLVEGSLAVALSALGKSALPALSKGLTDKEARTRRVAAYSLVLMGDKAAGAQLNLTAALNDTEPLVREYAAAALGKIGPEAKAAGEDLKKALGDKVVAVRLSAALALWRVSQDEAAVAVLVSALRDKDENSKVQAARNLGSIGKGARPAVPELSRWLEDKDAYFRSVGARSLGQIGPDAAASAPRLVALLKDEDQETRIEAALAVWRIAKEKKSAFETLAEALKEGPGSGKRLALEAAADIGASASDLLPLIAPLLRDDNASVRRAAASAYKSIDPDGAETKGIK